jgi:hypothetical protein
MVFVLARYILPFSPHSSFPRPVEPSTIFLGPSDSAIRLR